MRAHQIMTRKVITVGAADSVVDAANIMLTNHVSGLPMVDESGRDRVGRQLERNEKFFAQNFAGNESAAAFLPSANSI